MKIFLLLIAILISYPVFASCPVGGNGDACIADVETLLEAPLTTPIKVNSNSANNFKGVPNSVQKEQEIEPEKNLRKFGANGQNYGYNSSCQFGVCMETGTPQNFPSNND